MLSKRHVMYLPIRFGVTLALLAMLSLMSMPVYAAGKIESESNQSGIKAADLDVLFIGAHPDDEAGGLSTYGQWNEYEGVRTGVVTITRGEGGGNAVGPEEGPALGLLREAEERKAVTRAGIENIYNLDKVDFYYTVSAPLTEQIWGHESTLEKVVRILRKTQPEVIVTMNPSPTPGNHGHHQYAARLAIEAFYAAADSEIFPEQINKEKLRPWKVNKIFYRGAAGSSTEGPGCAETFEPDEPTDNIFGVWGGRQSEKHDKSWAQIEREAQRDYVSQGWSVFPDVPSDSEKIGCDYFTLIDSRVPFNVDNADPTAMLEDALLPVEGGLPVGTEFYLTTDTFKVVHDEPFTVKAHVRNTGKKTLLDATVRLNVPEDWKVSGDGELGVLPRNQEKTTTFTVTPVQDSVVGRVHLEASVDVSGGATGKTNRIVQVAPKVEGTLEPLKQVEQFQEWAEQTGVPQLDNLIKPRAPIGVGEKRKVQVNVTNYSDDIQSGEVTLDLPNGFTADETTKSYSRVKGGATETVTFEVTNTDTSLKTSNEGGIGGDYNFTVVTTSENGSSSQTGAFNLVPVTTIHQADTEPDVDGIETPGEYAGHELDLSRVWEGESPSSPEDASGSAKVTWHDDALYFLIHVQDETLGTVLPPSDAKRHWRTDSIEIAIDPRGDSENTSTTFKASIFPTTNDPDNGNPAVAYRDADAYQGPVKETAPGMEVKSTLSDPYNGYTIEAKIPMSELPAAVDPEQMGLNIFIYDSDTQDKTGQSRLGWSTWSGVQGDPYRWGHAFLKDYQPPGDRPVEPADPIIPQEVAQSVSSPQSIVQSVWDGVALSVGPAAPPNNTARIIGEPKISGNTLTVKLKATGPGTAHVFAWSGTESVAKQTVAIGKGKPRSIQFQLDDEARKLLEKSGSVLVGFDANKKGTTSLSKQISK